MPQIRKFRIMSSTMQSLCDRNFGRLKIRA